MTGIESRILRIEKRQPSRGSLDFLTTDEIEELQRAVCGAIVSAPESSPEDRAEAQSTIAEIDRGREAREALGGSRFIHGAPDDARMAGAVTDFVEGLRRGQTPMTSNNLSRRVARLEAANPATGHTPVDRIVFRIVSPDPDVPIKEVVWWTAQKSEEGKHP